jgi:hypothetical protein
MLDTFHWYHGEGFDQIIEDLLLLPADQRVIADGFRLLPGLVKPRLADPSHAVWLLPTPRFRSMVFDGRGGTGWGFIAKTGDPEQALRNLQDRDALFTDRLAEQTSRLGLSAITVDLTGTEDELTQHITTAFGLRM